MIEIAMYVGIGLLTGCLLALCVVPLVHDRAVRLTVRRLEERTAVLERIATDPAERTAREIEQLR